MNRRHVPMPPDPPHDEARQQPDPQGEGFLGSRIAPGEADADPAAPVCQAQGRARPRHDFAAGLVFIIVTAVALYFAKWPILLIAALVGFFRGLWWLCHRFPRTMFVISAIVSGLLGRRRW